MKQTIFLTVSLDVWEKLKPEFRDIFDTFKVEPDDYAEMKDDETFIELYSAYKKARRELDKFKYSFRNDN